MQGDIIDINDEWIGVRVTDNTGCQHKVAVEVDGEIRGHSQEGYPDDPADRTPEGNEHVEQARKFAQYYVYVEKGYDTVPPSIHPERLDAVRSAVAALPTAEFEDLFGNLYAQLQSHHGDAERVVEVPDDAADPENVLYRQNVYLGVDPLDTEFADEAETIAARHDVDLSSESVKNVSIGDRSDSEIDDWVEFAQDLGESALEADADLSDGLYVDAVSSVHTTYLDAAGEEHVQEPAVDPFDREPDAMFELPVMEPGTVAEFRDYLNHNLACQVRDSFVRMGLEPPEPFQVLGYGRFEAAEQYRRLDMFPNYVDPEEERAFI